MKLKTCLLGCILSMTMVSGIVKADPAPQTCEVDYTLDAKAWNPANNNNATYTLKFMVYTPDGGTMLYHENHDTADITDWTNPVIKLNVPIKACDQFNHITINSQKDSDDTVEDATLKFKDAKDAKDLKDKRVKKDKRRLVGTPGPGSNNMYTLCFYNIKLPATSPYAITLYDSTKGGSAGGVCCGSVAYGNVTLPACGTKDASSCTTPCSAS